MALEKSYMLPKTLPVEVQKGDQGIQMMIEPIIIPDSPSMNHGKRLVKIGLPIQVTSDLTMTSTKHISPNVSLDQNQRQQIQKRSESFSISRQFSKESEHKVNETTLDDKRDLLEILNTNQNVDSFYLAEILLKLKKRQEIIDLL